MRKNTRISQVLGGFALLLVTLGLLFGSWRVLTDADAQTGAQAQTLLDQSIRRAVLSCYANEGFYPPTLDYVTDHYGVSIDESRFAVFYEIFADNIMPEITVVPLEGQSNEA